MKLYIRAIKYYLRQWQLLLIVALSMFVYSTFSSVSVWMVAPFINTLFSEQGAEVQTEQEQQADQIIGDNSRLESIKETLNDYTNRLVMGETREDTLKKLCLIILFIFFIKNLSAYTGKITANMVKFTAVKNLRDDIYKHYCHLSLKFFTREKAGVLISHILSDVNVVNNSFQHNFITLLRDPLQLLISLFIIVILSWRLTLFTLIILPISAVIIAQIGSSLKRKSKRSQEKIADVTSILQETISGIRIVKAFAMEEFEMKRFGKMTGSYKRIMLRQANLKAISSPLTEFLGVILGVFILWYGGRLVLVGQLLAPEDFIRFVLVIFSMMTPLKAIGQMNNKIQEGLAAAKRIFDILETPQEVTNVPNPTIKKSVERTIHFENVSFRYTDDDPIVLRDIGLDINAGEMVALVGPSGAGKSTIVDLVCRFYDPINGKISIDGVDLKEIEIKSLRQMIGFVTQDPILFNDTITANIGYGSDTADKEQLITAAKAANAHDFITRLPNGYDTIIGDRGVRLSGGEKQRISIARAIFKNPPILIFDEATSSLDTQSEMLVQSAIERLIKDRTSIVIAHRMSTIRNADKIVTLEKGKVVGIGPHDELMETCELYQKLYNLQFRDSQKSE